MGDEEREAARGGGKGVVAIGDCENAGVADPCEPGGTSAGDATGIGPCGDANGVERRSGAVARGGRRAGGFLGRSGRVAEANVCNGNGIGCGA